MLSMMIRMINDAQTRQRLEMRRRAVEYEAWMIAEQAREEVEHESVRDASTSTPQMEGELYRRRNSPISHDPSEMDLSYAIDRKRAYDQRWSLSSPSQHGGHFIKRPKLHPRARVVSSESYHSTTSSGLRNPQGRAHAHSHAHSHGHSHGHSQPCQSRYAHAPSTNGPSPLPSSCQTDKSSALWNAKFEELKAFKAKYGSCNVPQCDPENKQLGVWLRNQRTGFNLYKTKGKGRGMTEERIRKLESLGVE